MENTNQTDTRKIETETCGRCGGSGHYSYCQRFGTTCFGCGGSGKSYTKRGAAAAMYLKGLRSKPAKDFVVGDMFYMEGVPGFSKGGFSKVTETHIVENAGSSTVDGVTTTYSALHISTEKLGDWQGSGDTILRMGLTAEQKLATLKQALDYQDTLTKTGTVRKRKGGK